MSNLPPNGPREPRVPTSPDALDGGVRGRVSGVTRVGPRAFAAAFVIVCGLLIAILYGLNKNSASQQQIAATATQLPVQPSDQPRFGANEPIVATAPPATAPPPLLVPPTSVPNLDNAQQEKNTAAEAPPPAAPAAPATIDPAVAQREAAEEQARAEEEKRQRELRLAALKSPILTGSGGGQNGPTQGGAPAMQLAYSGGDGSTGFAGSDGTAGGSQSTGRGSNGGSGGSGIVSSRTAQAAAANDGGRQDSGNQFLNGPTGQYGNVQSSSNVVLPPGANPKDFLQAQRFAPVSPFEITAGSVLPAALITGIDSELPGLITAQIREDVYDTKTGKYMLIPRGSRLVGLYKSDTATGQSRIQVAWTRLIFPDTTSIDLQDMPGADVGGFAGLGGVVDNNYGRIFSAALLTSIIAAGLQLSQPQNSSILTNPSAGQAVSQAVGQQLAQTSTQIINKQLNIPPKIYVAKGYPFLVTVDRDIVLPGAYRGGE